MIKTLVLTVILSIGLFFSFYRLPEQYIFEFDREGNYNAAKTIVVDHKFSLIGPAVHSSIFMGPWANYLQAIFFVIFQGDPIYGAYLIATVNFAVFLLIYYFLKQTSRSQLIALCGAFLWVSSATRFNSLVTFTPLFSLIFLILYERFNRKKNLSQLFFLTLIWSLSLNFHPQAIFFGPVWLYAVILFFRGHKQSWLKPGIILLVGLLIPVLPVILFDFRHNFPVFRAITSFLTKETAPINTTAASSGFRLTYSLRQFSLPIALPLNWLNHNPLFSVLILSLGMLFVLRRTHFFYLLLISILSVTMMAFYQQKTWPEYYHLVGGLSLMLLIFVTAGGKKITKFIFSLLSLFIIWSNLNYLMIYADPSSYYYKRQVILYMLEKNQPYEKMNIDNDFRFGEGLGFGPIREYYEKSEGLYPPSLRFYVSYADSPKHNSSKVVFGAYGVSMVYEK